MKDISVLKQYIQSVSKYPRVTPEEEIELGRKIHQGDMEAMEKLIQANLKLVVKISVQLCKGHSSIMDVIQNGNIGLIKAAEKFDPERGVRFSTYSAFWIKQSIMRGFIKPSSGINISYRKDEVNKKVRNFIRNYYNEHSKYPVIETIMEKLHVKRADAADVLSLYRTGGERAVINPVCDSDDEILDTIQDNRYNPETVTEQKLMNEEIHAAVAGLPERESEIIRKRFGFDDEQKETLTELGDKYDISAEATRQIERRVLGMMKMRYPSLSQYFYAGV